MATLYRRKLTFKSKRVVTGVRSRVPLRGAKFKAPARMTLARRAPVRRFKKRAALRRVKAHRRGSKHNSHNKSAIQEETSKIIGGALTSDKLRVQLPFYFSENNTVSTGTTQYVLKMNSIYDCAGTGGSQNAQNYARYFALYARALVRASRIRVRITQATTDVGIYPQALMVVVQPATSTQATALGTITDVAAFIQQPHAKSTQYIPGQGSRWLTHYAHVGLLEGLDSFKPLEAGSYFQATGADPSTVQSWVVSVFNPAPSSTALDFQVSIELTYYCEFFRPIVLTSQSLTTIEGNDFAGTPEEYAQYRAAHARLVTRPLARFTEEKKTSEPEFELVKIPKRSLPSTPASSSKK